MKATLLAIMLSLFVSPLMLHAESESHDSGTSSSPSLSQGLPKINLNNADLNALTQSFKGIGRKRAEAIIAYRESNGGFKTLDDLGLVKGIGPQFIERNRQQLQETYALE